MEFSNSEGYSEFAFDGLKSKESFLEGVKEDEKGQDHYLLFLHKLFDAGLLSKGDWNKNEDFATVMNVFGDIRAEEGGEKDEDGEVNFDLERVRRNVQVTLENIKSRRIISEEVMLVIESSLDINDDYLVAQQGSGSYYLTGDWSRNEEANHNSDKIYIKRSLEMEEIVKKMFVDAGVIVSPNEIEDLALQVVIAHELGHAFEAALARMVVMKIGANEHAEVIDKINKRVSEMFPLESSVSDSLLSQDNEFLLEVSKVSEERIARAVEFEYLKRELLDKKVDGVDKIMETYVKSQKDQKSKIGEISDLAEKIGINVSNLWSRLNSLSSWLFRMTYLTPIDIEPHKDRLNRKESDFVKLDIRALGYDYPLGLEDLRKVTSEILETK